MDQRLRDAALLYVIDKAMGLGDYPELQSILVFDVALAARQLMERYPYIERYRRLNAAVIDPSLVSSVQRLQTFVDNFISRNVINMITPVEPTPAEPASAEPCVFAVTKFCVVALSVVKITTIDLAAASDLDLPGTSGFDLTASRPEPAPD